MAHDSLKVYIETYGCQMNVSDSELVSRLLQDDAHVIQPEIDGADVVLVNTCAVREGAEQRVIGQLASWKRLKQERPDMILGVLGCMSTHLSEKLAESLPHVDLIMGPDQYRRLPGAIRDLVVGREAQVILTRRDRTENYEDIYPSRREGVNAWVTVMRGCDNMCTFCIVPFTRGRERSRGVASVVEECRRLATEGFREVTLLGQNVNSYRDADWRPGAVVDAGHADGARFPELLHAVSEVPGLDRIRFTSPHPKDFSEALIRQMAGNKKVCKHMHLPMQAGNDRVLQLMRREYTHQEFAELVDRARAAMPDMGFSTDIIVGFPTETGEEFRDTLRLVEHVRFDSAFTFEYSPREGAPSARWVDDVPPTEKNRRLQELLVLQRRITEEKAAACQGLEYEVLIESTSKKSDLELMGRTTCNRVLVVPADPRLKPGVMVTARVEEVSSFTLRGAVTQIEGRTPQGPAPTPATIALNQPRGA